MQDSLPPDSSPNLTRRRLIEVTAATADVLGITKAAGAV